MPIEHFGSAKISPNGQAGIPIDLRRALGIKDQSRPVQVFADVEKREIHLIEGVDAENLYELLRRLNRASGKKP
jgi:bifunctional DNA-binding transcriptional regulator/antitoxin component of YhaV-PrlF toxin-antitoxin module